VCPLDGGRGKDRRFSYSSEHLLRKLSRAERKREIDQRLADRKKLRAEIVALSKQRDAYIAAARKKQAGPQTGFDAAVAAALKEQLARKGIK